MVKLRFNGFGSAVSAMTGGTVLSVQLCGAAITVFVAGTGCTGNDQQASCEGNGQKRKKRRDPQFSDLPLVQIRLSSCVAKYQQVIRPLIPIIPKANAFVYKPGSVLKIFGRLKALAMRSKLTV